MADQDSKGSEIIASIDREIYTIMHDESWLDDYGLGNSHGGELPKDEVR